MLGFLTLCMFIAVAVGQTVISPSPSVPVGSTSSMLSSLSSPTKSSAISTHLSSASSIVPTNGSSIAPNATATPSPMTSIAPTKPSTTTKKPTEKPQSSGDYSFKENGNYCLLAKMDAHFVIPYMSSGNTSKTAKVHMPFTDKSLTKKGSKCGSDPVLQISWGKYQFTMDFESVKSGTVNATEWQVRKLSLIAETTNNTDFINATESKITVNTENGTELGALKGGMDGYYMCDVNETFPGQHGMFFFKYVKLQPFGVKANKTEMFGKEFNCAPSPTPKPKKDDNNIVPIAVGCALAGLVLIVLIAYIIGRRKSQRGYEKV